MGRTALAHIKTLIVVAILVIAGAVGITWAGIANSPSHKVSASLNAKHQLTDISYQGQNGVDALSLLKKHAAVKTKHYSFGDLVTSINGTPGAGPKYWTFYINGTPADMGASSYKTKSSDKIEWRLQ